MTLNLDVARGLKTGDTQCISRPGFHFDSPANPKLQAPNPNHSQLPNPKTEIPTPKSQRRISAHDLGLGSWDFRLEFGIWEWLGFGAWDLGFEELTRTGS